jgi:hypothetical protein
MAYEIIGETIKSATSLKLGQIFEGVTRYKEAVVNVKFPHFFIKEVSLDVTHKGKDRLQLDYLMNIRYRIAEDLSVVTNVNQQLDEVGLKLCTQLTELDLELPTKTKNRTYEKDDGVLQFFFNITIFAKPETEDEEKFKELELNEEVI